MKTDKSKNLDKVMLLGMEAFDESNGIIEEKDEAGIGCTGLLLQLTAADTGATCKISATFEDGTGVEREVSIG